MNRPRHDGSSERQAARWVPDHLEGRERVLGRRANRHMTVGDISRVLAAMLGDSAPQEPSAAWCPRCQEQRQERVHMNPRVRIRADLSWACGWCGASADAILTDTPNLFGSVR